MRKKKKIFTSTINEESFILSQFLDKIDRSNFSNELKLFASILRKDYFYFKGALFPVHNKYTKLYYFYFRHSCVKKLFYLRRPYKAFLPLPLRSRLSNSVPCKIETLGLKVILGVYPRFKARFDGKYCKDGGGEESRIFQFLRSNFTQEKTNNRWLVWVVCYSVSRNVASRKCKYCYTMKFKHYHPK